MRKPRTEKRRYPRIQKRLPLKIIANGYDFTTSTKNISCIGAYCHVDKYVPPFTKLAIRLTLPINRNRQKKESEVETRGVVVRSEDQENGGFNLAIFFNRITESQRGKIAHYVNQFLP